MNLSPSLRCFVFSLFSERASAAVLIPIRLALHMARIVPQPDHRLGKTMMFIRQYTQTPCAQQEIPSRRRFESEPSGSKHTQEMTAGKKQNVTLDRAHAFHHAIRSRA